MIDSLEAKGKRQRLVNELRKKGIDDEEVLKAMNVVPRHVFMDDVFLAHAYSDKAFPISSGQTISQPYTVAFQSSLLKVEKRSKILEIGTGSGYQAAVLAEMGAKVFTIERFRELHLKAQSMLQRMGYHSVKFFFGDGHEGKPQFGPYDGIIITAATKEIPPKLLEQLKIGGRLVAPVGEAAGEQIMTLVIKKDTDTYEYSSFGSFAFVPMLTGTK